MRHREWFEFFTIGLVWVLGELLTPSPCHAGGGSKGGGNGAGVQTCPDLNPNHQLTDLWEASSFHPFLKIHRSNEPVHLQIESALNKIDYINTRLGAEVRKAFFRALQIRQGTGAADLLQPGDGKETKKCRNGKVVGVALWTDTEPRPEKLDPIPSQYSFAQIARQKPNSHSFDEKLEIDTALAALDPYSEEDTKKALLPFTDQAAVWIHEAVYKVLRLYEGVRDSVRSKEIVGYVFSSDPIPSAFDGIPQAGYALCHSKDTEVYLYPSIGQAILQLIKVNNIFQFFKTTYVVSEPSVAARLKYLYKEVPDSEWDELKNAKGSYPIEFFPEEKGNFRGIYNVRMHLNIWRRGRQRAGFEAKIGSILFRTSKSQDVWSQLTGWEWIGGGFEKKSGFDATCVYRP